MRHAALHGNGKPAEGGPQHSPSMVVGYNLLMTAIAGIPARPLSG